jgi:siroheme decarboxylase
MSQKILDDSEHALITAIQTGFPLTPRPFQDIGKIIGRSEDEVIADLDDLQERGVIKRLGVIVKHRELGFRANAMVVWNIPDDLVDRIGEQVGEYDCVTLCYQRRRSLPQWPFNLYCMIHGRERQQVLEKLSILEQQCGMDEFPKQILFSRRRFKQQGAQYFPAKDRDK